MSYEKYLLSGFNIEMGGFALNLPSLNIINTSIEGNGIGGFIASSGSVVQAMTQGARAAFCFGAVLSDPAMLLKTLNLLLEYITTLGLDFINDLYQTLLARVNNILSTVYGIVLGVFDTIKSVISMVTDIVEVFNAIIDFFKNLGNGALDAFLKKEGCEYVVANLLRCMIGKLITPYLDELKLEIEQDINNVTIGLQNDIIEETSVLASLNSYTTQQAAYVNKFKQQVEYIL